ncbi:MAG: hypothetical protein ACWA6X_10440 [Bauldia sp.]
MTAGERGGRWTTRTAILGGLAAAALMLSACDDGSGEATAPTPPTTSTTASAAPAPSSAPRPPAGPLNLSVADLVGQWAPAAAACADAAQVMNISSTAVIRPGGARSTINATAVSQGALTLQLAQTVNGIRRSEVWRFESTTTALPVLGLTIAVDAGEPATWARCTAGVI